MPPTTIASSSSPPGDADLQELYNQVLSAFAEESSPSKFSPTFSPNNVDHDPPYSQHSDEPVSSYISTRPHTQSRGEPPFPLFPHHSSKYAHKPPPALVTTTVPSLLRQRIPPLLLRARAPALSRDSPAPPPHPLLPTLPICQNLDPSFMILTPRRLLLGPSLQPSSA